MAYLLRYGEELRDSREYFSQIPAGTNHIDKKQLAMATQLIEAYSHPFNLDAFKDDYEAALRELIEAKQKNAPLPLEEKRGKPAKVINLMDALRQSVSKAKRPVASERRTSRAEAKKGPVLVGVAGASTGLRSHGFTKTSRRNEEANRPLARYQRMRDFSVTAEPRGDAAQSRQGADPREAAIRSAETRGHAIALRLQAGLERSVEKLGRDQRPELLSRRQAARGRRSKIIPGNTATLKEPFRKGNTAAGR